MWHRFGMMDHQCALASLFATLLGLRARGRTGEGQFVSASLLGASILSVSETVVLPDGRLAAFERLDSQQMGVSPTHRLFACEDGWILVDAPSPRELLAAFGLPLGTPSTQLESLLTARSTAASLDSLGRAGIPAELVRLDQGERFLRDADNRRVGLSVRYLHASYGWVEQIGALWQMGSARLPIERAAPTLGQHTRSILDELGFSTDEIERLITNGIAVDSAASA
jgi:crotonobetainyl-CoA:carnitine CoA-transferase CaiB-like acyl-CoA transferase